jgi:DNA-binding CsgD family transcriptional regulator/GAF domain-containing protein
MRPDGLTAPAGDGRDAAPCDAHGALLPAARRDELGDALVAVRRALGGHPDDDPARDFPRAQRALSRSWAEVFQALSSALRDGGGPDAAVARYLELLEEIRRIEAGLLEERLRHRDAGLGRLREALSGLRDADCTGDLVSRASGGVCALGFDRSMVSRVEESSWIPEQVWVERDAQWAEQILRVGKANPQILNRSLVETEMIRRKVGILVDDVQQRPAVNRPIAEVSLSESYVAVPLLAAGEVVGFVHADCYYQRRSPDDYDRQLLTMFAEGVSHALARTTLMDQLNSIRSSIDEVAGALAGVKDEPVRLGAGTRRNRPAPAGAEGHSPGPAGRPGYADPFSGGAEGSTLTRREVEVLRLMATGDTNGRIARRLVISEGTVKSHVKHILRKLGAANRAEAVSRWLGMERARGNGQGQQREA